jgi:hypothetical protein
MMFRIMLACDVNGNVPLWNSQGSNTVYDGLKKPALARPQKQFTNLLFQQVKVSWVLKCLQSFAA